MGQGPVGAPHTYSQFSDMVFGHLPKTQATPAHSTLIGDHGDWEFSLFMDDHIGAALSFEAMFNFLHFLVPFLDQFILPLIKPLFL